MIDNTDFEAVLAQLVKTHQQNELANPTHIHLLAHNRYEPAKIFFIKCLDDNNQDWRYECLMENRKQIHRIMSITHH